MTKPRTNSDREIFGIIGKIDDMSAEKKWWNSRFLERGIDACMDSYPTKEHEIPERLSEMFHFDRRGYIVGEPLQEAILPLLDHIDPSAVGEGRVSFVANRSGILTGYFEEDREKIWSFWLAVG